MLGFPCVMCVVRLTSTGRLGLGPNPTGNRSGISLFRWLGQELSNVSRSG